MIRSKVALYVFVLLGIVVFQLSCNGPGKQRSDLSSQNEIDSMGSLSQAEFVKSNQKAIDFLDSISKTEFVKTNKSEVIKRKYIAYANLINSLIKEDFSASNNLLNIKLLGNWKNDTFNSVGWIDTIKKDTIFLLSILGVKHVIDKSRIIAASEIRLDEYLSNKNLSISSESFLTTDIMFDGPSFRNLNIAAWLIQKKEWKLVNQLFDYLVIDSIEKNHIAQIVGHYYFNVLLSSFSISRDFNFSKKIASFFESPAYKNFKYRAAALKIGAQINDGKIPYQDLPLPSKEAWTQMKKNMTRQEQIDFLSKKFVLLNYFQDGQPNSISYDMFQTSLPWSIILKDTTLNSYESFEKYRVINPYNEILALKPSIAEVAPLVDMLADSTYILAFTYFRDFFPDRTIHQINWVVNDLLFEVTKKRFIDNYYFEDLNIRQQTQKINEAKAWFEVNK